jgi:hypothetical protein
MTYQWYQNVGIKKVGISLYINFLKQMIKNEEKLKKRVLTLLPLDCCKIRNFLFTLFSKHLWYE